MPKLSMTTWRRLSGVGLLVHGMFITTVAVTAYQGSLWVHVPDIPNFDTAGHLGLIGLVAFFLDGLLAYRPVSRSRMPWLRVAPIAVFCAAAIEEAAQLLSPHRTASWSDLAADAIGIVFFSWLSLRLCRAFVRDGAGRSSPRAGSAR